MGGPMTGGSMGSRLTIGVLLPDVLGTYADCGNAVVLAQRARWAGVEVDVLEITADASGPVTCDIYVLGGGEDAAQVFAAQWLARQRGLRGELSRTAVTFAVCAGFQILGSAFRDVTGRRHEGLAVLDVATEPRRRRAVGEAVVQCDVAGVGLISGFENHLGATTLGPGVRPLGILMCGVGNGSEQSGRARYEGAVTDRVVATYLHGPVLARNPDLADHVLGRVLGTAYRGVPADAVPDQLSLRAGYLGKPGQQRRFADQKAVRTMGRRGGA
jgi:CobQ-like glutamine amidotransferase family enzyme